MHTFRTARRSAALLAGVALVAGLVAVQGASPASARSCASILTAGPGSPGGSIFVTFAIDGSGATMVEAFTEELDRGRPLPVASTPGNPAGTELGGLTPSTTYWIEVSVDGSLCGSGRWVTSSGLAATTLWFQSYGRLSQDDRCLVGWWPSYGEWMSDGKGGWTCDRYVPKYG